jgi:PAS domain S-box-containing protein
MLLKADASRFLNPIAVSYTGYAHSELVGRNADFLILPEDRAEVRKKAAAMLRGKRNIPYDIQDRYQGREGLLGYRDGDLHGVQR